MDRSRKILDAIEKLDEEVDSARYYGDGSDKGVEKARVGLVKELIAGGCVDKKSGVEFVQGDLISLSTRPTASGKRHRPSYLRRNSSSDYDNPSTALIDRHAAQAGEHEAEELDDVDGSISSPTDGRAAFRLIGFPKSAWPRFQRGFKAARQHKLKQLRKDRTKQKPSTLRNPRRNLAVHSTIRYEVDADSVHKATKSFVELKKKRCLTRRDVDVLVNLLEWAAGVMTGAGVPESIRRRAAELHIAIKNHMAATGCAERNMSKQRNGDSRDWHERVRGTWRDLDDAEASYDRSLARHALRTAEGLRKSIPPAHSSSSAAQAVVRSDRDWANSLVKRARTLVKKMATRRMDVDIQLRKTGRNGADMARKVSLKAFKDLAIGADGWNASQIHDLGRVARETRMVIVKYKGEGFRVFRVHPDSVQSLGREHDTLAEARGFANSNYIRNAPKNKGKKMAKNTKKKTSKKGGRRPATPGGQRSLGIPMGLGVAAYYKAAAAAKKAKKKAKKKATKKKAKKKTTKRTAPKRKAPKKKAKKLTAAQKLARKRSAAVRKAKRTRMAVKASACRVGRVGRVAQGKKPGRCPPKPKLRKGKVGAPMAGRMHRSQGHKVSQKTSELIRNFYNLKNELD